MPGPKAKLIIREARAAWYVADAVARTKTPPPNPRVSLGPLLRVATFVGFMLLQLSPTDPAVVRLGENATDEAYAAYEEGMADLGRFRLAAADSAFASSSAFTQRATNSFSSSFKACSTSFSAC